MAPSDSDSDIDCFGSGTTIDEQATAWFVRLRSGSLSEKDRQAFESWLRQSQAHARAFDEACRLWDDEALKRAAISAANMAAVSPVPQHRTSSRTGPFWRWGAAAVACAAVVVTVYQLDIVVRLSADHRTVTGEQLEIQLPDHSTATLNTRSAIAVHFDGTSRKVRLLDGEAFFQVEPDRDRPFMVEGQQIFSRAVGTKFLVRRQPKAVSVTVVEGVVELAPARGGWKPVRLTAGRQATADIHTAGPVREVDLSAETAWLRGRLVFENARLSDVIDEIRRYHNGVIVVWNPTIGDIRVSGSYTLNDLDGILTTLAQTLPIRMARIGNHVAALF